MSELNDMKELMQHEHATVLLGLGRLEGAVSAIKSDVAEAKVNQAIMVVKVGELSSELKMYRNYFIGFVAAISIVITGTWRAIQVFIKGE